MFIIYFFSDRKYLIQAFNSVLIFKSKALILQIVEM